MLLSTTLLTILILLVRFTTTFEPCDGDLCPPVGAKWKLVSTENIGPAPVSLGRDEKSGCHCREHPRVYVVCFNGPQCTRVPRQLNITTPLLKLTGTSIVALEHSDFELMLDIETLQIDGNYNLSEILPGAFNSNLTKLTNLSISFNPNLKTIHPRSFEGLVNLRVLYLIKNGFKRVYDITQALSSRFLPNLFILSLSENNFLNISANDFVPMENSTLEELNLVLCTLEYLDPNCFSPLTNLEVLRLGENSFSASTITDVIAKTVEFKIQLKLLNLYSVGFRKTPPRNLLEAIAKSNISILNLAHNQFEFISNDTFPYMPNLRVLDLREVLALQIQSGAFYNLPNLKTLLLSGNKLETVPEGMHLQNLTYLDIQQNSGNTLNPSYFCIKGRKFTNMTRLIYLNLNYNRLNILFNTSFDGLENLQVLGLKNCSLYRISNNSFAPLNNLKFLNLENNYFIERNYPVGIEPDIFKGLDNLRVLLLGGCRITYFSKYKNPFMHLKNLEHLGLERNNLKTIEPSDFNPLVILRSVDLSENLLTAWQERIFSKNLHLKTVILNENKFSFLSRAMLDDFSKSTNVELNNNPLSCDCKTYNIISKWFFDRKIDKNAVPKISAQCVLPENANHIFLFEYFKNVSNNSSICSSNVSLVVVVLPVILPIVIFLMLSILMYRYRWHIRYWVFLTRLNLSRRGKIKPKTEKKGYYNYTYDAFVSYSNEDRNFVVRMVSMLENYEPYLKLCVYERDFEVGAFITESVLESVAKSRRTLLIISDNYVKSQWCKWESQIAEHHSLFLEDQNGEYVDDSLVMIKLGPVNSNNLTPTLRYLLKTRIYLQWEVDEKKQKTFWERLRNALAPPKMEPQILENTHI